MLNSSLLEEMSKQKSGYFDIFCTMLVRYNFMEKFIVFMCAFMAYINFINLVMKKRKTWTREIFSEQEREMQGIYEQMFQIIKKRDEGQFIKFTRMGVRQFELLLSILKGRLTKNAPRKPIDAECRLLLTLVYLAQGCSRQMLSWAFRMGVSTVGEIILETCDAIWEELSPIYLAQPNENEWNKISKDFYNMSGMPNCVGAIDAKHIRITCPPNAGSLFYNYKNYHSIVLLGVCDSNYCFTAVDIGAYGSQSDGGIFAASSFGKKVLDGSLPLPPMKEMPRSDVKIPYYFVGDAAFPLKTNLMRPYPGRLLPNDKEVFNKTLSSARRMIENTFGIMSAKWRVLLSTINCFPENADKIIKAVVVLHNFVKMNDGNYCPSNYVDHYENDELRQGLWRIDCHSLPQTTFFRRNNATRTAFTIRDTIKDYIILNKRIN